MKVWNLITQSIQSGFQTCQRMTIPLRSEFDQNPLEFASSRSELWCKHLPQRPAGFHGITVWHSNGRISSVYHQNSSHLSISKNTRIVLGVHVLGGMIPQRVVDAYAVLQSSKCFVCARLHLDSHEKLHSRPKSSDVFRWVRLWVRLYARQPRSETFT